MRGRQKAAAPQAFVQRLAALVLGDQHAKGGQVVVGRAQAVAEPRSDRRPPGDLRARLEERDRRVVVDGLRIHRLDETQVVRHAGGVRQQFAEPRARLAVLLELEHGPGQRQRGLIARHACQTLALTHRVRQLFAVFLVQQRLVVEQVDLRRPAAHEQVDHAFGLGRMMELGHHAARQRGAPRRVRCQQMRQSRAAQPHRRPAKEVPARHLHDQIVVHDSGFSPHRFVTVSSKFMIASATTAKAANSVASSFSSRL